MGDFVTADSQDNFEYLPAKGHDSKEARRHYWAVAIGLQKVDGLEVSPYLKTLAKEYIEGERTLDETGQLIREYHGQQRAPDPAKEADLVSQRIAELLSAKAFSLAPDFLREIHKYLFQDLDNSVYCPGEYKTERMIKQEGILNGDSVLYADPLTYGMSLQAAFAREQGNVYGAFNREELGNFCKTISILWQVHPFAEGNTRTLAVFSELYLNNLGFNVTNEPFESHSLYFRNALVRANYRNAAAGVFPEDAFLIQFYENVLGHADYPLNNEDLVCESLFENPDLLRNVEKSLALKK